MEDIKKTIRDLIRQKGTIRKIVTDLGMDHANLLRLLREGANLGLKSIEKILDYLDYEIKLIKRKGLTPIKSELQKSRSRERR
jgi:DNA-binding phage protein